MALITYMTTYIKDRGRAINALHVIDSRGYCPVFPNKDK